MNFFKRQQIYINSELQIKMAITLVIVVTAEVLIFGGVLSIPLSMSRQAPENIYRFYLLLLITFASITILNIFLGIYLSHKVAGPIYAFELRIKNITNGDISKYVDLRKGDLLKDFETSFNEMMKALRTAVVNDRKALARIHEQIALLDKKIEKVVPGKEAEELRLVLEDATREMKSITGFFKI